MQMILLNGCCCVYQEYEGISGHLPFKLSVKSNKFILAVLLKKNRSLMFLG